mmetsp:Transcript_29373/g.79520  ORF Transcript_29373/g.79520 Transcript_29373/m.79520 type:complete len:132 (+) Transcript_29373:2721-3116(+)
MSNTKNTTLIGIKTSKASYDSLVFFYDYFVVSNRSSLLLCFLDFSVHDEFCACVHVCVRTFLVGSKCQTNPTKQNKPHSADMDFIRVDPTRVHSFALRLSDPAMVHHGRANGTEMKWLPWCHAMRSFEFHP